MMLNYDAWSADESPIVVARRARDAWRRIQRRPTSIVIARGASDRPAQTVRIELSNTTSSGAELEDASGNSSKFSAVVFGVKGHPDPSVPNTDILRDDRFALDNQWFRVVHVTQQVGEVQASCEVES